MKKYFFPKIIFSIILFTGATSCIGQHNKSSTSIDTSIKLRLESINKIASLLETQIDSNRLFPYFEHTLFTKEPTEGVPPQLRFYFDEKWKLKAVTAHVGFETWGKTHYYFFYENEKNNEISLYNSRTTY